MDDLLVEDGYNDHKDHQHHYRHVPSWEKQLVRLENFLFYKDGPMFLLSSQNFRFI